MSDSANMAVTTVFTGENDGHSWKKFLPIAFGGHCFYVRQDLTGEQDGPGVFDRSIGGIAIPEASADRSQTVVIVGIGPNIGKNADKSHRRKWGWPKGTKRMSWNAGIGDRLLIDLPPGQTTTKLQRSPYNWNFEMFIEESLPVAVLEDE